MDNDYGNRHQLLTVSGTTFRFLKPNRTCRAGEASRERIVGDERCVQDAVGVSPILFKDAAMLDDKATAQGADVRLNRKTGYGAACGSAWKMSLPARIV